MRNLQPHAPFIGLAARSYMVNIEGSPWRQERVRHIEASPTWQQNASDVGTSVRTNKPGFHIVFQKWDGSCLEASQTNKFIAVWHHMTSSELTQVEPPSASSDVTPSNHHVMSSEGGGASCLTAVAIGGTQVLWDVPVSFSVWGSAPNWTDWMLEDKRFIFIMFGRQISIFSFYFQIQNGSVWWFVLADGCLRQIYRQPVTQRHLTRERQVERSRPGFRISENERCQSGNTCTRSMKVHAFPDWPSQNLESQLMLTGTVNSLTGWNQQDP